MALSHRLCATTLLSTMDKYVNLPAGKSRYKVFILMRGRSATRHTPSRYR
jgi:hypothetical protein